MQKADLISQEVVRELFWYGQGSSGLQEERVLLGPPSCQAMAPDLSVHPTLQGYKLFSETVLDPDHSFQLRKVYFLECEMSGVGTKTCAY